MQTHEYTKRIVACWEGRLFVLWDGVIGGHHTGLAWEWSLIALIRMGPYIMQVWRP